MAKLSPLFSSSSGNCFYYASGGSAVLVDAGVSCRQILTALAQRSIAPESIGAVFITHSHDDHVKGLRVLLNRLKVPVLASAPTLQTLRQKQILTPEQGLDITKAKSLPLAFGVQLFATSHDCPGSGGYVFTPENGEKTAICTDLGEVTETVRQAILGCKTVVIESNHDVGMLQNGSYPYPLKQRILSNQGHLSNGCCATELPGLVRAGAREIILAHLSKENNTPQLAEITAVSVLTENSLQRNSDYRLQVAPPSGGPVLYI